MYVALKIVVSAALIAAISEVGKRSPGFAALIASLPLVSVLGMVWLWRDTREPGRLAAHGEATFFYVLPSLPMFLLIPVLLRRGVGFYPALLAGCAMTVLLYVLTVWIAGRFGLRL